MKIFLSILVSIFVLSACTPTPPTISIEDLENLKPREEVVVPGIPLTTDLTGAKIEIEKLAQGCLGGQDCIPSIDKPEFESIKEADLWLNGNDIVFTLNYNDVQKAYPQRILNWHEIVNDSIGDDDIIVTFCPLCGSALAFKREVNKTTTQFGVSGKLYNSDLVMYDRFEGNLWQQITGEAIVGPAAQRDEFLKTIPITTTTWDEWKAEFPDTQVLSRNTTYSRDYDAYPYGTYEYNDEVFFGGENLDTSLQIKTVVYGIEIDGKTKAYTEGALRRENTINDQIGKAKIKIIRKGSGEIIITNSETGEIIPSVRLFWFSWATFNPDTELYK